MLQPTLRPCMGRETALFKAVGRRLGRGAATSLLDQAAVSPGALRDLAVGDMDISN